MKSGHSEFKTAEQHQVKRILEQDLPLAIRQDIQQVRQRALNQARVDTSQGIGRFLYPILLPTVLMLVIALVITGPNNHSVPLMPGEFEQIPTEDLALLEDLDFADWLVEQEVRG